MGKKIVIAGAGHGGLIAGARLAAAGYDVTIYERKIKSELGYDWDDAIALNWMADVSRLTFWMKQNYSRQE